MHVTDHDITSISLHQSVFIRILLTGFVLFRCFTAYGTQNSITVSVLTLEPGREVYTVFGHSAIRIKNTSLKEDRVYNFGMFDFDDSYFYLKFVRGNLRYFLSVYSYNKFIRQSEKEQRTVYEQVLNLSENEKQLLSEQLEACYHSNERYYTYDFFYNNCATKVRDYLFHKDGALAYDTSQYCCKTFRQLIKPYISHNYWLNLGINLALGKEADKQAQAGDYMFLPYYIRDILPKTGIVTEENLLLDYCSPGKNQYVPTWLLPYIIVVMFLGLALWPKTRKPAFYVATSVLGLVGLILFLVSMISQNNALSDNLNVYWTIPSLLILLVRNKPVSELIKVGYLVLLVMIMLMWNLLPQKLSDTFIPWMLMLILMLFINLQWIQNKYNKIADKIKRT